MQETTFYVADFESDVVTGRQGEVVPATAQRSSGLEQELKETIKWTGPTKTVTDTSANATYGQFFSHDEG